MRNKISQLLLARILLPKSPTYAKSHK